MKRSVAVSVLSVLVAVLLPPADVRSEETASRYYYCKQAANKKADRTPMFFYSNVFQTAGAVSDMGAGNRFYSHIQERYGGEYSVQAGATYCFGKSKREAAADDRGQAISTDRIGHQQLIFVDDFAY